MKRFKFLRGTFLASLLLVTVLGSCIKEDQLGECVLTLEFKYDYNVLMADAFASEVDEVTVYIFDKNDKLVKTVSHQTGIGEDFRLRVDGLDENQTYKFVAWANSGKYKSPKSDFELSSLSIGSKPGDLTAYFPRTDNVADSRVNSTLCGVKTAKVTGLTQNVVVDMVKCTNLVRVILMPNKPGITLDKENYGFTINGSNGWLNYKGDPYKHDPLTYLPYYQDATNAENPMSKEISSAVVADFSLSRLLEKNNPHLTITDKNNGNVIMDINLTWVLSLTGIGEHRSEWSNQEYLDRQDQYSLVFFIDADKSMWEKNTIVVNGWVLSLDDVYLK